MHLQFSFLDQTYLHAINNYMGECGQLFDNAIRVSGRFAYQDVENNQLKTYEGHCDCKYIYCFKSFQ